MKFPSFLLMLYVLRSVVLASSENEKTLTVALSPITPSLTPPVPFAVIAVDPAQLDAHVVSYDNPESAAEDDETRATEATHYRVGIYDPSRAIWTASTTLTSATTFAKGYAPTFVLTVGMDGDVISVSIKGARIDAGQTRDFGPQAVVRRMHAGPRPDLNRPVVLIEGKVEAAVPEKSFLQKYWWILLAGLVLMVSTGGDAE
ncbi:hypothetical protein K3495_g747 [Podosphaera aphanis]|nr:hypothetical protein K3495_g747 [Podosphaera aphanis]